MKRPLTGLALLFATGILAGSWLDLPLPDVASLTLLVLLLFGLLRHGRAAQPLLMLAVVLSGALAYSLATVPTARDITRLVPRRDQPVGLRGLVVNAPAAGRFHLQLSALFQSDGWQPAAGRVLGELSAERAAALGLRYGDQIECQAILRVPRRPRNPGGFDQHRWLARQHIHFVAAIGSQHACRLLARDRGHRLVALGLRLRGYFERALRHGIETEPAIVGVLTGMVIGLRADIPEQTYADFQRTGVLHVFAVSGMHVALIALVLNGALQLLQLPRRWCGLVGIPLLVLYVFAVGAPASAVRAFWMVAIWLGGWALVRPSDGFNSLAGAALVILVLDPLELFDGGFQLSVAAVLVLLAWAQPTQQRLRSWLAPDPLIPRRLVPRWRRWLARVWNWVAACLAVSWVAWVGLVPLMAWYFNLVTPIGVLSNLVVVPVVGLVTGYGLVSAAVYGLCPWLSATINNANWLLLNLLEAVVSWLADLPAGHWFVRCPPLWWVVVYLGLLVLWTVRRRWWPWWRWVALGALPAVGALLLAGVDWRDRAEITVLHMEEGAAVFVDLPGQRHDWLIDGGGTDGRRELVPFLRSRGVDRLAGIIVTCKNKAHVTGLRRVIEQIPVGELVVGDTPSRSGAYARWRARAVAGSRPIRAVGSGDSWSVGDLRVRVLSPGRLAANARVDDASLVLLLEYGPTRVLLLADAGAAVERQLLQTHPGLRAAILVKGNHGRESSGQPAFLATVRPAVVVQTGSQWNWHRYQDPLLPSRVAHLGARWIATEQSGAVQLRLDRHGYTVHTFR